MHTEKSLVYHKPYLILIGSQMFSGFGDWLQLLAVLSLSGFKFQASPLEMSVLMMCFAVPAIGIGPLAGVLADRYNRKTMMILSEAGRSCIVFLILFVESLWHIYVLTFLLSAFSALFVPAKNGKLKEIVSDSNMQQAVSISGMIDNGSKMIGPALGGVLIAFFGINFSFYLNAALFLLSSLLLTALPKERYFERESAGLKSSVQMFADFKQGIALIQKNGLLLTGLTAACFVMLAVQIADSQIVVLIRELPKSPVELIGTCMTASGTGMLLMTALLGKIKIRLFLRFFIGGTILLGISIGSLPFMTGLTEIWVFILFSLVFFFAGAGFSFVYIPFHILAQKTVPVTFSGRVFGSIQSMTTFASVAGMSCGGLLSELAGVKYTFILSGCLLLVTGAVIGMINKERGRLIVTENHTGTERQTES
ncbi:MFS transporter [Bacillus swezeyi]|uniref:MFS transporter n=1 Tax=Bacillus swezeyi TaxID=1925020 RepID=UPI003F8C8C4E